MRKRTYAGKKSRAKKYKSVVPRGPVILPGQRGFVRTSGAYGRFSGTNGEPELKVHDVPILERGNGTTQMNTFGVSITNGLCVIPQGTDDNQRIGRKITLKSLQFRGLLKGQPAQNFITGPATSYQLTVYLYLVQDTQANGTLADPTDVLTGTIPQTSMVNLDNSMRFRILKKWVHELEPKTNFIELTYQYLNDTTKHIEWYKKCDIPVEYSGPNGTVTEIRSNNLFFLVGYSDAAYGRHTTVEGVFRIRYADC